MADQPPVRRDTEAATDLGIDGLSEVAIVGSGGSSMVYRARQDALDRTVAVKVAHAAWSIEARERFEHERQVMGRTSGHWAAVPIFQTGITARGEPYLVMPFYSRGSLFRLMSDRGPLPWREATFVMETLAQTVAEAHRDGIVHRDIKPGNVLLTNHLQPRLTDFGITLPTGTPIAGTTIAYTPSYSAPEAFEAGVAEPTVDVYSLGATLWALLAGRAPATDPGEGFEAPTPSTPEPLARLLVRSMAEDPRHRPEDAGVFAAELRRAVRRSEGGATASRERSDRDQGAGRGRSVRDTAVRDTAVRDTAVRDTAVRAMLATMIAAGTALLAVGGWQLLS